MYVYVRSNRPDNVAPTPPTDHKILHEVGEREEIEEEEEETPRDSDSGGQGECVMVMRSCISTVSVNRNCAIVIV